MFGPDIILAISDDKYYTLKHNPLGLGLIITTQINQITFLHCLDVIFRIGIESVELSKELLKTTNLLPLKPDYEDEQVTNLLNLVNENFRKS